MRDRQDRQRYLCSIENMKLNLLADWPYRMHIIQDRQRYLCSIENMKLNSLADWPYRVHIITLLHNKTIENEN